jgi:HD-like signal output (HDOD) protein
MDPNHSIPRPHYLDHQSQATCERLIRLAGQRVPDLREIARLTVSVDRLNQRVIRAANASSFGLTSPITSLEQAVAYLGARRVREITEHLLRENRGRSSAV